MDIFLFVTQAISTYGINLGLDKIFKDREDFSNRLYKIINSTIDDYEKKFPISDKGQSFPFYKSEILIEEFLKFRLFSKKGHKINQNTIQAALERNPNIIKPNAEELENFFQIFDKHISGDEKFRMLEIEAFHKEVIYDIYDKVERILNILETQLVDVIPLLDKEYQAAINESITELKKLKPKTALKHLQSLEVRVNQNVQHVSNKVQATLKYYIGICFEALESTKESYENFIRAYKLEPYNKTYIEKACISYYLLEDSKYKVLKEKIEEYDEYNVFSCVIDTIESENIIEWVKKSVSPIVIEKKHYQRILFNINQKNKRVNSLDLIESLKVSNPPNEFPDIINYDNIHHWIFILNVISVKFFFSHEIPFFGFLEKNEESLRFLNLSKILSEAIKTSELSENYNTIIFNYYWLESEIDNKTSTIEDLKVAYNKLREKDSFRTLLMANSIQKHESTQKALKYIEEFQGDIDDNLISLKTICQLSGSLKEESATEYFKYVNQINALNANNTCIFLISIISSNLIQKPKLKELLEGVRFSKKYFKELIYLILDTFYPNDLPIEVARINNIKEKLKDEIGLNYYIALLYFENKYIIECIRFQEIYLDENKESRDLFLFIRALNETKSQNQLKLLRLLKKWRVSFTYNSYFLRIELELQQILKDWEEIEKISRYALTELPKDEVFYTIYIIALSVNGKSHELENEINKIKQFDFKSTENTLKVTSILLSFGFKNIALELIYIKALNKSDSLARVNYFTLPANLPTKYFEEFEEVVKNCYVKFDIDGEVETFHVNDETIAIEIVKKAMGKSPLQTFTISKPLSNKLKYVKILRIMNKYLALYDEILTEANSSFSNLPVESVEFDSNNIEDFERTFIEHFGVSEDEKRKHTRDVFRKYHAYEISFTELVNSNFSGSFIEAYYHLISNQSEGYLITPLKYFSHSESQGKKVVIDFSSALLFFELENKLGLTYDKFVVSKNIYIHVDKLIAETESLRNSRMSVSLYNNKIIPHFLPEDFHDKRIEHFQKLKRWFRENTISENPEEKLEIIRPLFSKKKVNNTMEYIIDNTFLAQRKGYMLITDDVGYKKMFNINNWLTTEIYLQQTFPNQKIEILEAMLSYRYVGLTINSELLYLTYINHFKEGNNHIFNYALRNLALPVNFTDNNISVVVNFLMKLAMNTSITKEKYRYDATNTIAFLISSFPKPSYGFSLREKIEQRFQLLGDYLHITLLAFLDALKINAKK